MSGNVKKEQIDKICVIFANRQEILISKFLFEKQNKPHLFDV